MFNWTLEYIISQFLIVIVYILICTTYFLKNRRKILITNIIAHIFQAGSFLLLNGLTGVAMNIVYVIRDSFFAFDEKNRKNNNLNKRDYIILTIFILIIIIFTIFTYSGWSSLLSRWWKFIDSWNRIITAWQFGLDNYNLNIYDLWTSYDLRTIDPTTRTYQPSIASSNDPDFYMSDDGLHIYYVATNINEVIHYELTTPRDASTGTLLETFSQSNVSWIYMNENKMYLKYYFSNVNQFTVQTV